MRAIGVCEGGIDAMQDKARSFVLRIAGVSVPAAHVLKQQMLSLGGDTAVHKHVLTHAIENSDVLVMGTALQLQRLAERLSFQPFDLPALGERIAKLLTTLTVPPTCRLRARSFMLDLTERVHVMGVLNVTPDSFSDGGLYMQPTEALKHALQLAADGADIIDVGGQSSRPGSEPVTEDEELRRVLPVVEMLAEEWPGPISVDTSSARVAKQTLDAGAAIINDIRGFSGDPELAAATAEHDAACILMHMQGTPATMQKAPTYADLMGEIAGFLSEAIRRAEEAGVGSDQIAVDPGIGFGKTTEHNLAVLKHLPELAVLRKPIVTGTSRKSFIGNVLDLPIDERGEGSIAMAAYAVVQGARIVRVHDVKPIVRAVRVIEACISSPE
ncbi:dihydropteroate synthase [bacterium]|nr:dihydropteroate synthase [bacterium]